MKYRGYSTLPTFCACKVDRAAILGGKKQADSELLYAIGCTNRLIKGSTVCVSFYHFPADTDHHRL